MASSRPCSTFTSCRSGDTLRRSASVPCGAAWRTAQPTTRAGVSSIGRARRRISVAPRPARRARPGRSCRRRRSAPRPAASPGGPGGCGAGFFFSSRRRHTISVSAFLLNRSSDLGLTPSQLYVFMPPNLGGFFMVRSYYPSECHADYFDFERIEALKPAIEACGISTLSQSPMLGFHKQMDNRIKLLEEILSFRMQGVEFDNGDMYVDGHKAASDVRDEFVSVTE